MKRRQQDSMGLMIDTMCNGVGGLVLVAILIVLVSISESPSSSEGQMQRKQLENEVQALRIKEEQLRFENQRMSENEEAFDVGLVESISAEQLEGQLALIRSKQAQILELEKRVQELQKEQAQAKIADPGEYVTAELEEYNRLLEEIDELEGELEVAEEDLFSKEVRYSELLSDVAEIKDNKSRVLKVPVERKFSRYDFIYFRYGKCYTLANESVWQPGGNYSVLERNDHSISFELKSSGGISLESSEMREFLGFVKRNGGTCSLRFYADSFHLFLPMKRLLDEYGLSLGVGFHTANNPPSFTTVGGKEILGQGQ